MSARLAVRSAPTWAAGQTGAVIAAAGSERGCLLVLEDLQGVATETLAVVEYLVDNVDLQPTVVLATMRAGLGPAFDLARAAVLDRLWQDSAGNPAVVQECFHRVARISDVPAA